MMANVVFKKVLCDGDCGVGSLDGKRGADQDQRRPNLVGVLGPSSGPSWPARWLAGSDA